MKTLLILITVLTAACQRAPSLHIDAAFDAQVAVFTNITGLPVSVSINFGTLSYPQDGKCDIAGSARNITIDPHSWQVFTPDGKEQLILHELGHCMFGLNHDSNLLWLGNLWGPESIMYPESFGGNQIYAQNKAYYYAQYRKMAHL